MTDKTLEGAKKRVLEAVKSRRHATEAFRIGSAIELALKEGVEIGEQQKEKELIHLKDKKWVEGKVLKTIRQQEQERIEKVGRVRISQTCCLKQGDIFISKEVWQNNFKKELSRKNPRHNQPSQSGFKPRTKGRKSKSRGAKG